MTKFIDVSMLATLLNRVGVERFLRELAQALHEDFVRWPDFEKCARTANHCEVGVVELMPVSDNNEYAFKYVNGHPGNTRYGLPTVMGFGALSSMETGYPLLLSELTLLTGLRTGATSALAAKALCRPDARSMAMIGCGAQSEFQILAFHELLGINEVRVYDIDPEAVAKLQRNLADKPINILAKPSTREAVKGADIVTTATADKRLATILEPDMIAPGMHINAIGGDCPGKTELHRDIVLAAKTFVEYEPQTRVEGEIQQVPADYPVTALWKVLHGSAAGRDTAQQITLFDSVGFAMEDYSALRYLYQLAKRENIGEDIELVPVMDNPKNLYGVAFETSPLNLARKVNLV